MKNFKTSSILFSLLAVVMFTFLMTSCNRDEDVKVQQPEISDVVKELTFLLPEHIVDQELETIQEYINNLSEEEIEQHSIEEDNRIYRLPKEFNNMSPEEIANLSDEVLQSNATVVSESELQSRTCESWDTYHTSPCWYWHERCGWDPRVRIKKQVRFCNSSGYEYRKIAECC